MRYEAPANIIGQLQSLYPDEYEYLNNDTDFGSKVCYGPLFTSNS